MTIIYGIKNCDTVKKARRWLEENNIEHSFFDVRADGITADLISNWNSQSGWQTLLNKRSTTWKNLDPTSRDNIDEASALKLMLEQPTLIKRPVLAHGDNITVGFKVDQYQSIFK